MKLVQEIYGQLGDPKRVVITMHQKPDADAMGSALALAHFFKTVWSFGKSCVPDELGPLAKLDGRSGRCSGL